MTLHVLSDLDTMYTSVVQEAVIGIQLISTIQVTLLSEVIVLLT